MLDVVGGSIRQQGRMGGGALLIWGVMPIVGGLVVFLLPSVLALVDAFGWELVALGSTAGALSGAIGGVGIGAIQRQLLPDWAPWAGGWVRATVIGWAIGGAIFWFCLGVQAITLQTRDLDAPVSQFVREVGIPWLLLGTGISVGQALVLRRRMPRVGWWLVITVAGWVAGLAAGELVVCLISFTTQPATDLGLLLLLWIIVAGIASLIAGLAMRRLLAQNREQVF